MIYLISVILCYTMNSALTADLQIHNRTISCNVTFTNANNEVVNLKTDSKNKPFFIKCCRKNEILFLGNGTGTMCKEVSNELEQVLKNSSIIFDYSDLQIYKSPTVTELSNSSTKFLEAFDFVQIPVLVDEDCKELVTNIDAVLTNYYILDDGALVADMMHLKIGRWSYIQNICMDLVVEKINETYTSHYEYRAFLDGSQNNVNLKIMFTRAAFLISSFFLVLLLLVYCALPQLRNLAGMLLMAYVTTLLAAFVNKATINFLPVTASLCANGLTVNYFLFQSSFLWLNIMSFDMWYTFRCLRFNRLRQNDEKNRFMWYGLYAWGGAAMMTIIAVIMDTAPLPDWPSLIRPGFSSYCGTINDATMIYLYIPMGILTLVNIALFLMTAYNIRLLNTNLKKFNCSSNNKSNQKRFYLYVRMSLLMGVSWMLEVLLAFINDESFWLYIVMSLYNSLIGVVIFAMFVFNMPTLYMLCKRFNIEMEFVRNWKAKRTRTIVSRPSTNKSSYSKTRATDVPELELSDVIVSKKS